MNLHSCWSVFIFVLLPFCLNLFAFKIFLFGKGFGKEIKKREKKTPAEPPSHPSAQQARARTPSLSLLSAADDMDPLVSALFFFLESEPGRTPLQPLSIPDCSGFPCSLRKPSAIKRFSSTPQPPFTICCTLGTLATLSAKLGISPKAAAANRPPRPLSARVNHLGGFASSPSTSRSFYFSIWCS